MAVLGWRSKDVRSQQKYRRQGQTDLPSNRIDGRRLCDLDDALYEIFLVEKHQTSRCGADVTLRKRSQLAAFWAGTGARELTTVHRALFNLLITSGIQVLEAVLSYVLAKLGKVSATCENVASLCRFDELSVEVR